MSNVILFNLTTVLFGVASALYLGALYAKNEKIAVAGTWVCIIAAVVSTAALGVRWYESYQRTPQRRRGDDGHDNADPGSRDRNSLVLRVEGAEIQGGRCAEQHRG